MKKIIILIIGIIIFTLSLSSLQIYAAFQAEENEEVADQTSNANSDISITSAPGGEDTHGEDWYGIEVDNNYIPVQYQEIDYTEMSKLLTHIKPGDIIYETNGSPIGDATKHIAIVYDIVYDEANDQEYVIIIESYTGGVYYGIMTPNRFNEKDVIIYRLTDASEAQIQGALTWIQSQLGSTYRFPFNKYLNGVYDEENGCNSFYCAELVWAAFYRQGIYLDWDDNNDGGSIISPYALSCYENLTTILHYNESTVLSHDENGHTYTCDGDTYTEAHDFETYRYCYQKCRACDYVRQVREHDYTDHYTYPDYNIHTAYCKCGHFISSTHDFSVFTYTDESIHTATCECGKQTSKYHNYQSYLPCSDKCVECGDKRVIGEHDYTYSYSEKNEDAHYAHCQCGAITEGEHVYNVESEDGIKLDVCSFCGYDRHHVHSYTYHSNKDGETHEQTCDCGISQTQPCLAPVQSGTLPVCLKCNQKLKGGLIIPFSDDGEIALLPNNDEDYIEETE